ncbi:XdhC family aldehyde oxidoreductase maturation factor [Desulfosarcina ovata]|uniref:Xanthine dehydrogenase n=1 Tax=Desulfosarcina ovata subsp. ovata TaxID=2752305 RepID=A0A5K8AGG1_9BACT|nr:XdhC/CoxI family protein [Desulfosarcina ovata]BBO91782.1 xanthine dehydrogenase [Desulfosarcina ovata subsp. ovata]
MDTIAQTASDLLGKGETFVLATIISHSGSTPRTSGSKMIVTADGRGIGTIGGGLLEAEVMSRAVKLIPTGASDLIPFDLGLENVASMDMICGGQAEVLLDCITPDSETVAIFDGWRAVLESGGKGCFVTMVDTAGDHVGPVKHGLVSARGEVDGNFPLSANELERVAAAASRSAEIRTVRVTGGFAVLEPAGQVCAAYLFGAGHVARATAHLASLVGFRVSVADDRKEYANRERYPDAQEVRVLEDFNRCLPDTAMGQNDFVIIVTRGHLHDKTVLAQALKTHAGYIGMIGSRRKRDATYAALIKEGFSQADIDRVHSPIGLSIGADTPEEIAVSIVGELIAHRAGMQL